MWGENLGPDFVKICFAFHYLFHNDFSNQMQFTSFLKIIRQSKLNYNNINEIFFYPSGRIDIKNKDNLLIKFPMQNLEEAIIIVNKIIKNKNFRNNLIDLRVPNQLILSNE